MCLFFRSARLLFAFAAPYLLICACFFPKAAFAQKIYSDQKYPLTAFRQPLDIQPPALAGSFGELRANHLHSGLDFRTNQRTGYPVYAVADGEVARLRVQNSGFGLALYIRHADGFTSVYGHLSRFSPKIARIVKDVQYRQKSYEIDESPTEMRLPVKKGEVIAYSGNTGSSGGPHLHFELRDTKTETTINAQLLGMQIPDHVPPVISALYVYRLNGLPFSEFTPKQYFRLSGGSGKYQLYQTPTIHLSGEVGFGLVTTDRHDGQSGLNGVYAIELEVDGQVVFTSAVERFNFENSRGINAHIDYATFQKTKQSIQKSFVDPGNPLQIYSHLVNNGRLRFEDGKLHHLRYTVSDVAGNKSSLEFNVLADPKAVIPSPKQPDGTLFPFGQANEFSTSDIKVSIPKGSLYNDLNFVYKKLARPAQGAFSEQHQVQDKLTPLHQGFDLWIKADSSLIPFQQKALIVNSSGVSQDGQFENGYVKAHPATFGTFYIAIDTLPPAISPVNLTEGIHLNGQAKMSFRISDKLSGIKSFNGYIDGKWVLMEFDAKTGNLWHSFDENTAAGKHQFELLVSDRKDNLKRYTLTFYR